MSAWTKGKKGWIALFIVMGALLAMRLTLATVVKGVINRKLDHLAAYTGHIDRIGLSLWRGAYQIRGMKIEKRQGLAPVPFFEAPNVDIGVEWMPLFHGRLVASVVVDEGQLNFVSGPAKDQAQTGFGEDWLDVLKSLVPLEINRFELKDSAVHFRDPYGKPPVDLQLDQLALVAKDLKSRPPGHHDEAFASVSATGRVMGDGQLAFGARFDSFASLPTFEYGFSLKGVQLQTMNPFLLRYLSVDVAGGRLDFFSEAAAADGKFKGYYQPMMKDLKVMRPDDALKPVSLFRKFLLRIAAWIFKNKDGQIATKFEVAGEFKEPQTSLWKAVGYLFQNAFFEALPSKLDGKLKLGALQKKGKAP